MTPRTAPALLRSPAVLLPVVAALAGLAALAASSGATPAQSAGGDRILPGREAAIVAMVRAAAPSEPIAGIAVDHAVLRVRREGLDDTLVVARRAQERPAAGESAMAPGVTLRCPGGCSAAAVARDAPFAARLARARDEAAARIWNIAGPSVRTARLGWRLLVVGLGVALARMAGLALPRMPAARRRVALGAALAVLAALAVTLAVAHVPLLPAHDHDTFIARADCAVDPSCERSPRGGWSLASLDAYGLFLGVLPYRLRALSVVSLAFAAASALLLAAVVARLAARTRLAPHAALTGTLAGLFLVAHPAWARVAAADTPWPLAATALLLGALAALHADDPAAPRWTAAVALGCFGLGVCSNFALLALAPLAVVAPWCFARRTPRPSAVTLAAFAAAALAFAGPVREGMRAATPSAARLPQNARALVFQALHGVAYLDPRVTPRTWAALALLGLAVVAARRMRPFAAVVLGAAATQLPLGAQVPLETGWPTYFVHVFVTHYFAAALAAVGAATVVALFPWRRTVPLALVAAAALLPWPRARETLAFARERRPLALEASALSHAFDRLPPHDVLVVPPDVLRDLGAPRRGSDPVEWVFPAGELAWVFRHRGLVPPTVVPSERFLREPPPPGARVLVYVGSAFRTFLRSEMEDGTVPPSLERPELAELRARYALDPVQTFTVPTAQHRFAVMRVLADRATAVTLGFYRPTPR